MCGKAEVGQSTFNWGIKQRQGVEQLSVCSMQLRSWIKLNKSTVHEVHPTTVTSY